MRKKSVRLLKPSYFYLMGALFLVLALIFLPGRLINIQDVECESQYGVCPEDIVSLVRLDTPKPLVQSKREIMNKLKGNLLISDYSIQYGFPNKLKVSILIKKPRFAILNKDTGKYLLVGADGKIVGYADETSLPTVSQSGDIPNILALELMEGVFAMYQISKGEIDGNSLVVELPTAVRVIFPLDGTKDKDVLLGSLRLIYSEVTDKEIDLRFKNALLR
jgi:hypothetical protein